MHKCTLLENYVCQWGNSTVHREQEKLTTALITFTELENPLPQYYSKIFKQNLNEQKSA